MILASAGRIVVLLALAFAAAPVNADVLEIGEMLEVLRGVLGGAGRNGLRRLGRLIFGGSLFGFVCHVLNLP